MASVSDKTIGDAGRVEHGETHGLAHQAARRSAAPRGGSATGGSATFTKQGHAGNSDSPFPAAARSPSAPFLAVRADFVDARKDAAQDVHFLALEARTPEEAP